MKKIFAVACLGFSAFACEVESRDASLLPSMDYDHFVTKVQPIFENRCANPSCHGNRARPFEVFAVQQHRMNLEDQFSKVPLGDDELRANLESAAGFVAVSDHAAECLLLAKPADPRIGGVQHGGGVAFTDRNDREYREILRFVEVTLAAMEKAK